MTGFKFRHALYLSSYVWLAACSWEPQTTATSPEQVVRVATPQPNIVRVPRTQQTTPGQALADIAMSAIGTPYRWGGTSRAGFDCSGLVYFAHAQLSIAVPRTAAQQRKKARPVALRDAQPGDLLFFDISGKTDHVGVYLGNQQFVHAPASGKVVQTAELSNPFYRRHLVSVGRLISTD